MTGYTSGIVEKNQTFEEFALSCARAFGALIQMRDEPMDAPIPDELKASDYYKDREAEATAELKLLAAMSPNQFREYGEKLRADRIAGLVAAIAKENAEKAKLGAMLEKCKAWTPPSDDHAGLKQFMIEQIEWSIGGSYYYATTLSSVMQTTPESFATKEIDSLTRTVASSAEEYQKEVSRVAARNKWVRELRSSLKPAAKARKPDAAEAQA